MIHLVSLATANPILPTYLPEITIKSDGSINPETSYINRKGNIYTLTTNLTDEYSIEILCDNIVFDGADHCINITTADNIGLHLTGVSNVTIKNIDVFTLRGGISLSSCSDCLITSIRTGDRCIHLEYCDSNTLTKSVVKISLLYSQNNLVFRNNVTDLSVILSFKNRFYQNNILCNYFPSSYNNSTDQWDDGSIGNYWVEYQTKYPNASEIGDTGVGNVSYLIDANNIDRYPLMYPFDVETGTIVFPTQEIQPEPFPVVPVAAAFVVVAIVAVAGLLLYSRKCRKEAR